MLSIFLNVFEMLWRTYWPVIMILLYIPIHVRLYIVQYCSEHFVRFYNILVWIRDVMWRHMICVFKLSLKKVFT